MLLGALCWYFQPTLLPIISYLFFEFIVQLIAVYHQNFKIVRTESVPEQLKNDFDKDAFQRARLHSLKLCKLECFSLVVKKAWTLLRVGLGMILFDFALNQLSAELEGPRKSLGLHFLTLELISITATFTLIKRLVFVHEPIIRNFVIGGQDELNNQTSDEFMHGFFHNVLTSILKNCLMVSSYCELSSIVYDVIGLSWPSMCIAYWVIYIGLNCCIEYLFSKRSSEVPNEILTPIKESSGLLPKFIKLAASQMGFPEDNIFVSDNSKRTEKQSICLRGLMHPKLIIDDHLLKEYENIFNPPSVEEPGLEMDNENESENPRSINDGSEILSLVTVECARWKFNGAWQIELFDKGYALLTFGFLSFIMMETSIPTISTFYAISKQNITAVLVPFFLLFLWAKQQIKNSMKRSQELAADNYAVNAGYAQDLKKALIDMHMNNLEFPLMSKMYETTTDRNSLLTRIEAIDRDAPTCSEKRFTKLFIHSLKN